MNRRAKNQGQVGVKNRLALGATFLSSLEDTHGTEAIEVSLLPLVDGSTEL